MEKQIKANSLAPSDEALLKLDNQLCFALYVSSKEIIRKYKPLLDPYGLTYTGYITIMALWEKDNITVKALGERLYLDSGTLTPLLKKLENLGYISRIRSTDDERQVYIVLTEKGQDFKKEAVHIPKDLICAINLTSRNGMQLIGELHEIMVQLTE